MEIIYKKVFAYNDNDVNAIIEKIKKCKTRRKNKIEYFDIPAAFDIETSLIKQGDEYYSNMYIWQFGVGIGDVNYIIYGRHWEEFEKIITRLGYMLQLGKERRFIIYIHNLSYEFAFLARRFTWKKVFSMRPHKPLFAIIENGVEFRCSYLLSGLKLEKVGKELTKYKAKKQVGDLDYSLIRSSETPLSKEELRYCIDDIHVLLNYIREYLESVGGITKIPLTKTGEARIYTRRKCFGTSHKKDEGRRKYEGYRNLMKELTMSYDEYIQAKYGYTGGFTHQNAHYVDKILFHMGARDISSSYPTQLCANGFPMSAPTLDENIRSESDPKFLDHLENDCCIFYIKLWNVTPAIEYENFLSRSKVYYAQNTIENNGRVVSMDYGLCVWTEIDYEIAKKCYHWEKSEIYGFRYMKKSYLPKDFILSILSLYRDKTTLKGIAGKEDMYMRKKSILNSIYGMTVTSPIMPLVTYETTDEGSEWGIDESKTEEELLEKYNNNPQRFSYYYWGIWTCKYAMRQLWDAIFYLKNDYVYTDTDSVKYRHPEKHHKFFEEYNEYMFNKLKLMCDYYTIPYSFINPEDKKGKKHPLGAWDIEADENNPYKIFKGLGSKRYIYYQGDHVVLTTAGVRKEANEYLKKKYGKIGLFEAFNVNLKIPAEESGKLQAHYTDCEYEGYAKDYLGNEFYYHELSGVAIVSSEYNLSRGQKFADYILGLEDYYEGI